MVPSTDLTHRRHPRLVSARYVDFEILPTSTLKGGDLKRWLVWRAILESMSQPMPPPKAKSSSARPARGARAAAQAAAMTTPANDKDDVTVDENHFVLRPGFNASVPLVAVCNSRNVTLLGNRVTGAPAGYLSGVSVIHCMQPGAVATRIIKI